jgi:acetyl esterase/lipase
MPHLRDARLVVLRAWACAAAWVMVLPVDAAAAGGVPSASPAPPLQNVAFSEVLRLSVEVSPVRVAYGSEPLQYGELWLPSASASAPAAPVAPAAPLVVMIHGGCWLNAFGVDHTRPAAAALSRAGFAVWSLEYRRTGDTGGGWPGSVEDIRLALDGLPRLDSQPFAAQRVDLARVAVLGHSAGGHLALLAARGRPGFRVVAGLSAITDLVAYGQGDNSCQRAVSQFMGGSAAEFPERYRLADPAAVAQRSPTVLLHGTVDAIVPLGQARLSGAETVVVAGAGHFDWVHPGTSAFERLLGLLRERLSPSVAAGSD